MKTKTIKAKRSNKRDVWIVATSASEALSLAHKTQLFSSAADAAATASRINAELPKGHPLRERPFRIRLCEAA